MPLSTLRNGTVRRVIPVFGTLVFGMSVLACHDLTGSQTLPAGTQDPSYYSNATGALGMRNTAVVAFGTMLPAYIITTGLLTDELADPSTVYSTPGLRGAAGLQVTDPLDERILPELAYGATGSYASDGVYSQLQGARLGLLQAIGQLTIGDTSAKDTAILKPSVDSVLRGELYALYGLTEIQLADLFCSGIPLSTLDFQKDFTYRAGSTTIAVYQDAIAKLDTAFALSADSVRIQNLARVGLGRAYVELAYTNPTYLKAAADDVSLVPTDFQYQLQESWACSSQTCASYTGHNLINVSGVVSDHEGVNGLSYLSSRDPRTADTTITEQYSSPFSLAKAISVGYPRVYQAGLSGTGYTPITVASGIEARLIEAEAALSPNGAGVDAWLTKLNQLRETAIIPGRTALLFDQPDSLPDLSDPGIGSPNPDSARIALTFQERAAWLYMTGQRQGDLRRQLRQYHQYWGNNSQLYPTGVYLGFGAGSYGTDVTAPIPAAEYINPLFQGCKSRDP